MWLFRRKKFDGQIFAGFMILYGIERYFIEFLRDDPGRGEVFGGVMTGTQLISICLVISGGLIWWLKSGSPSGSPSRAPAQSTV
jgi:phosphatidylglycerol:prolipoprotein diacylglycerol transferase